MIFIILLFISVDLKNWKFYLKKKIFIKFKYAIKIFLKTLFIINITI